MRANEAVHLQENIGFAMFEPVLSTIVDLDHTQHFAESVQTLFLITAQYSFMNSLAPRTRKTRGCGAFSAQNFFREGLF